MAERSVEEMEALMSGSAPASRSVEQMEAQMSGAAPERSVEDLEALMEAPSTPDDSKHQAGMADRADALRFLSDRPAAPDTDPQSNRPPLQHTPYPPTPQDPFGDAPQLPRTDAAVRENTAADELMYRAAALPVRGAVALGAAVAETYIPGYGDKDPYTPHASAGWKALKTAGRAAGQALHAPLGYIGASVGVLGGPVGMAAGAAVGAWTGELISKASDDPAIRAEIMKDMQETSASMQSAMGVEVPQNVLTASLFSGVYAGKKLLEALGDFTLLNKIAKNTTEEYAAYSASDPEVKSTSTTLNALANTVNDFGPDIAMMALPVERLFAAAGRAAPALASGIERSIPAKFRAATTDKLYAAAVRESKKHAEARAILKAEKLSPDVGTSEWSTMEYAENMWMLDDAATTPAKLTPMMRLLAQAENAAGAFRLGVKEGLVEFRKALDADPLQHVAIEFIDSLHKRRMARNVGKQEAATWVKTQLDDSIFGTEAKYNDAFALQKNISFFQQLMGSKDLVGTSWWNRKLIKDIAKRDDISHAAAAIKLQETILNIDHYNRLMETTYIEAGKVGKDMSALFPDFVDMLDDLSTKYMSEVDAALVNPLKDVKTGIVDSELFGKSKATAEQVSGARTKAFDEAWAAHSDAVMAKLTRRFNGDEVMAARVHKTLEVAQRATRSIMEKLKLEADYGLREGWYQHQMRSETVLKGTMRETAFYKALESGSKKQRMGKIKPEDMEFNIRDIMEKDLSEVYASKIDREAFTELVKNKKAWRGIKKGETLMVETGLFGRQKTRAFEIVDGVKKPTKYVLMQFDGLDRHVIRQMLAVDEFRLERGMRDQVAQVLDEAKRDSFDALDPENTTVFQDGLSADQLKKVNTLAHERKVLVHEDLIDYLVDMRKQQASTKLLPNMIKAVNFGLKPIQTGLDFGGIAQRISIYSNMLREYGVKNTWQVFKGSNRLIDDRLMPMVTKMAEEGSLYHQRIGISELKPGEHLGWAHKMGILGRYLSWNDRVMYGRDFANAGFDMRTRISLRKVLEDNYKNGVDEAFSMPSTKKMSNSMLGFTDSLLGKGAREFIRNDKIEPLRLANAVARVMGDYNAAARTPFQTHLATNYLNFYGWWRGTFTPMLSAPGRHPVRAVGTPLMYLNGMNLLLSGKPAWENDPGKRFSIKVDPKHLGKMLKTLGINIGKVGSWDPFYWELPTNNRRMFGIADAESWNMVKDHELAGRHRQGLTLASHLVIGGMTRVSNYANPIFAVPTSTERGRLSFPGYPATPQLRLIGSLFEFARTASVDEWTPAMDAAVKTILSSLSFSAVDLYDNWRSQGLFASIGLFTSNTFLGQQMSFADDKMGRMGWNKNRAMVEAAFPTAQAIQDNVRTNALLRQGNPDGFLGPSIVGDAMAANAGIKNIKDEAIRNSIINHGKRGAR